MIAGDFGTTTLSTGQSAPERQSLFSLGQTAIFNSGSQMPFLESRNIFSSHIASDLIRITKDEINYTLIVSSVTERSPPLSIS